MIHYGLGGETKMRDQLLRGLGCCLVLFLLSACAAGRGPVPSRVAAYPPGTYLAWPGPRVLDQAQVQQRLARAQVVLVGETHDHPGHHAIQLQVLKSLLALGYRPVVAVEWLDHTVQKYCDQLSRGQITVERFARLVDWKHRWGYPLKLYRPILELVRSRRLTLVAANAPAKTIRQVARKGLASLSREQRSQLAPALDLDDPAYQKMLAVQFAAHGLMGKELARNFAAAQIARDETMARELARRLYPWPDSGRRGVLLAGGGHLAHGLGLAPRIERRLPGARVLTVLPVNPGSPALRGGQGGQAAPAGLVVVSTPPPPRRPRLGVSIKAVERGLLIERIWPATPAQRAGLEAGDLLLAVDGRPLRRAKDIHDIIKAAPFAPHRYRIERKGRIMELSISLGR